MPAGLLGAGSGDHRLGLLPRPMPTAPQHFLESGTPSLPPLPSRWRARGTLHRGCEISNFVLLVTESDKGKRVFKRLVSLQTSVRKIKRKGSLQRERTFSKFITRIHYSWATFEKARAAERNWA